MNYKNFLLLLCLFNVIQTLPSVSTNKNQQKENTPQQVQVPDEKKSYLSKEHQCLLVHTLGLIIGLVVSLKIIPRFLPK